MAAHVRQWSPWLVLVLAPLAPVVWELISAVALATPTHRLPEITNLLIAKTGFALLLGWLLTRFRLWRVCGFGGGFQVPHWGLLWPIWLATLISAIQSVAGFHPIRFLAWLLVALAVSFGEEGIFRGVVIAVLRPDRRPVGAVLTSSLLFGMVHLIGLAGSIDPRMIVAQACVAGALGIILGATRLLTGSIWPGMVAHWMLDFFGLAAADGVASAMGYSEGAIKFLALSAAVAGLWGCVLLFRLRAENDAIPS